MWEYLGKSYGDTDGVRAALASYRRSQPPPPPSDAVVASLVSAALFPQVAYGKPTLSKKTKNPCSPENLKLEIRDPRGVGSEPHGERSIPSSVRGRLNGSRLAVAPLLLPREGADHQGVWDATPTPPLAPFLLTGNNLARNYSLRAGGSNALWKEVVLSETSRRRVEKGVGPTQWEGFRERRYRIYCRVSARYRLEAPALPEKYKRQPPQPKKKVARKSVNSKWRTKQRQARRRSHHGGGSHYGPSWQARRATASGFCATRAVLVRHFQLIQSRPSRGHQTAGGAVAPGATARVDDASAICEVIEERTIILPQPSRRPHHGNHGASEVLAHSGRRVGSRLLSLDGEHDRRPAWATQPARDRHRRRDDARCARRARLAARRRPATPPRRRRRARSPARSSPAAHRRTRCSAHHQGEAATPRADAGARPTETSRRAPRSRPTNRSRPRRARRTRSARAQGILRVLSKARSAGCAPSAPCASAACRGRGRRSRARPGPSSPAVQIAQIALDLARWRACT